MASTSPQPAVDAKRDPPWSDCGDLSSPDLGLVFGWPVADGALALSFDRAGRRHALTVFNGTQLGSDIIIYGRRFSVVRETAEDR